jgi:20S proteasome alpha/beta subunit
MTTSFAPLQTLPNLLRKPYIRPAIKANNMTIGVAAVAERKYIVTASDKALSAEIVSDDCIYKVVPFHREWSAIFSGSDISDVVPVMEMVKERFTNLDNTHMNASEVMCKAYSEQLSKKIERLVLGRYQMSLVDFLKNGRKYFRLGDHSMILQEIRSVILGCSFLVSGFDGAGEPHIFMVNEPGISQSCDKPGFWSVGSGGFSANTLLLHLGQNIDKPLEETIYNVCAAKFFSEKSLGVGKETWFFIKTFGSDSLISPPFFVEEIRAGWETFGQPRIPNQTVQKIKTYLQEKKLEAVDINKRAEQLRGKTD